MQLQEMGFPRSPVAEELLIKHSNKLEVVVNALLAHPEQGRCVQENQSTKKKRGMYRRVYDAPYPVLPPLSLDVPVPRLDQPFQLYDVPRSSHRARIDLQFSDQLDARTPWLYFRSIVL